MVFPNSRLLFSCPILITFGLFNISYILSAFNPELETARIIPIEYLYGIPFCLYFLAISYKNKYFLIKVNKWLFISTIFAAISSLIGIGMGWGIRDILADLARYLGPIVGYSAGLIVLRRLQHSDIIKLIFFILLIQLFIYYFSLYEKIADVASGGNLFNYAKFNLKTEVIFFLLFAFFWRKKVFGKFTSLLVLGYLIGYVVNPLLVMSKSDTIIVLFSIAIVFLFIAKIRLKLFLLAISFILLFSFINNPKSEIIFKRFSNFFSVVLKGDYSVDASTSFRITELNNVGSTLINNLPYSFFFGMGAGALYYDVYSKIKGGIHAENFRSDGGIHHIFNGYLAYLYRYGVFGSTIILVWLISVIIKLRKELKKLQIEPYTSSIMLSIQFYIILSLIAENFVPVNIYGNMNFGYFLAMAQLIAEKTNFERNNFLQLTSKNYAQLK